MCIGSGLRVVFHTGLGTLDGKGFLLDQMVHQFDLLYVVQGIVTYTLGVLLG